MEPTRRERLREATLDEIKTIAWRQIATQGAPSLSLRAIAREIGMTAPALYDSVADRFAPQYDITGLLTNVNRGHAEADYDAAAIREAWRQWCSSAVLKSACSALFAKRRSPPSR